MSAAGINRALRVCAGGALLAAALSDPDAHGATITYLGLVDGAGQNVFVNYGTAAGGYVDAPGPSASGGTTIVGPANNDGAGTGQQYAGAGYAFNATTSATATNGGTFNYGAQAGATNPGANTALNAWFSAAVPPPAGTGNYRAYPGFLSYDPVNYSKVGTNDSIITTGENQPNTGANFGAWRFAYAPVVNPANGALLQVAQVMNNRSPADPAERSLIDLRFNGENGSAAPPASFVVGVVVDTGNGFNDTPDGLRLSQANAVANPGGTTGGDSGLITVDEANVITTASPGAGGHATRVRQAAGGAYTGSVPGETDVLFFRVNGAVLGDVLTLSGTEPDGVNMAYSGLVFQTPVPEPAAGLAALAIAAGALRTCPARRRHGAAARFCVTTRSAPRRGRG